MPAAIPTLGYPSRTAACLALREQGLDDAAIAAKTGIEKKNVSALLCGALKARSQRPAERNGRTIVFPNDILEALHPYAGQRGKTVNAIAREIVDTVVQEGLVDAVLDDGDEG